MIKSIRKNQKKALAIFTVLLMITFALDTANCFGRKGGGGGGDDSARVASGVLNITQRDVDTYGKQWAVLSADIGRRGENTFIQTPDGQVQPVFISDLYLLLADGASLPKGDPRRTNRALRGQQIFSGLARDPKLFAWLAKEAEMRGIRAGDDMVVGVLGQLKIHKESGAEDYARVFEPMRTLLSVTTLADRVASTARVSEAALDFALARQQTISLNMMEFDAAQFRDANINVTDAQINEQFEKFKNQEPEAGKVGYRYPNSVRYERIAISEDEVRTAMLLDTAATKDKELVNDDDIAEHYHKNKDKYPLTSPATQPATQPVWFEHRKEILKELTDAKIAKKLQDISNAVSQIMQSDYKAYVDGGSKPGHEIKADADVDVEGGGKILYASERYIKYIKAKVKKDFKIGISPQYNEHWSTFASLSREDDGRADAVIDGNRVTMASLVGQRCSKFLTPQEISQSSPEMVLDIYEPSPVFRYVQGTRGETRFIIRVTDADPAHSLGNLAGANRTESEIKALPQAQQKEALEKRDTWSKVREHVKTNLAMDAARKSAQAALKKAEGGMWLRDVADKDKHLLLTTPAFGLSSQRPEFSVLMPLYSFFQSRGYKTRGGNMDFRSLYECEDDFLRGLDAVLRGPSRPGTALLEGPMAKPEKLSNHPIGLIELPEDQRILVVEVNAIKPQFNTGNSQDFKAYMRAQEMEREASEARARWLSGASIKARLDIKESRGEQ